MFWNRVKDRYHILWPMLAGAAAILCTFALWQVAGWNGPRPVPVGQTPTDVAHAPTNIPARQPTATVPATVVISPTAAPTITITATATPSPTPTTTPEPDGVGGPAPDVGCEAQPGELYTIRPGDTLWDIAGCAYGAGWRWVEIDRANGLGDPALIHAGNSLIIPHDGEFR